MDSALSHQSVSITPRDRLGFALFLVVCLHAAIILGVTFVWQGQTSRAPTIEVTLAQYQDQQAPDEADFLAQHDQLGSGMLEEVAQLTTIQEAELHTDEFNPVLLEAMAAPAYDSPLEQHLLSTVAASPDAVMADETPQEPSDLPLLSPTDRSYQELVREVASMDARLDHQVQQDAKHPRVTRLTTLSARRSVHAYYLQAWTRQVEAIGNLNYPEEARRDRLYGSLRLLVAITPDGALKEVSILESSGHRALDEAAVRIVHLAAPFAPFPEEMRRETDVLEIIRTWQFRQNRYSSSS